jgi:hypothetical protein
MMCLSHLRKTDYSILQQPDLSKRDVPQPDYLIEDSQGNLIAIEHTRFFESQSKREREAVAVKKKGEYIGFLNFPASEELGKRLSDFFDDKLSKGQFTEFGNCELILLARNRWSGLSKQGFLQCESHFKPLRRQDCDHFYLIVKRELIEVF